MPTTTCACGRSVITTYNGQRALLEDVFRARCEASPLFGMPAKIVTVDKYQGQQNDIVLLSLVRTRTVGHVRDIRRLIVALSRAQPRFSFSSGACCRATRHTCVLDMTVRARVCVCV